MENRIGFIGLGIMGAPMAARLLEAKYPLVVHTRTKSKASRLLGKGAIFAATPAEVAAQSDVVFISVTDTPDVEAIVRGPDGIDASARRGLIVVDHSTISPTTTKELADELGRAHRRAAVLRRTPERCRRVAAG